MCYKNQGAMKCIKRIYRLLLCFSAIILICFVASSTKAQLKQRGDTLAIDNEKQNNESLLRDRIKLQSASNKQIIGNFSLRQLNETFDNIPTIHKNATHEIKEEYTNNTQPKPVTTSNANKNATNRMKKEHMDKTEPRTENASSDHENATSDIAEEYSNNTLANSENASNNHENATGETEEKNTKNTLAITENASNAQTNATNGFTKQFTNNTQVNTDNVSNSHKNGTNEIKKEYTDNAHTNTENASDVHVSLTGLEINRNKQLKIGILIPSSTFNIKNPVLNSLSLTTLCLPSLYKTFDKGYLYRIYIGIDQGDYLETVQNEITGLFSNITVVILKTPKKSFTRSVNLIATKAYEDGMDYFVRINDDTSFESKNWTSSALDILLNYTPPNVGVVGPFCEDGNNRILTHDMVHRTHFEIFGFYYPLYFNNWWTDDWITKIYHPERSTKIDSWKVKHHTGFQKRRYNVKMKKFAQLESIIADGRSRVAEYLNKTLNSDRV